MLCNRANAGRIWVDARKGDIYLLSRGAQKTGKEGWKLKKKKVKRKKGEGDAAFVIFFGRNQLFAYTEAHAANFKKSDLGRYVSWGRVIMMAVSPHTFPHEVSTCND